MEYIHSDDAPAAIGPYSQAIAVDGWLYTSGQIALDPKTGQLAAGFEAQVRQVFKNLEAVLAAGGCTFQDVVKATVYLQNFGDFGTMNQIYEERMGQHKPARSTVQAASLPRNAMVEIDFVARIPR